MSVNKEMKVLIVDDYQTMRRVICNLFNQIGFESTLEAGTTHEALELLKKEGSCGLIVFDWHTGPMKGEDFLTAVRADDALKDIPFVVVSSESSDAQFAAMKEVGVSDFIAKPFTKATLKKRMMNLFGSF